MRGSLAAVALLLSCSHAKDASTATFRGVDGAPLRLSDLRGQVVLLDFWATWCVPCKVSLPFYARLLRENRGLSVLAVSTDEDDEVVRQYLARTPLPLTIGRDPRGSTADAMGVALIPTTYVLDRQGRIRFRHQGFSEADEPKLRSEVAGLLAEPPPQ